MPKEDDLVLKAISPSSDIETAASLPVASMKTAELNCR